jgi:hypothetical protein
MELKNAQKRLSLAADDVFGNGMRSTPTSALEVLLMLPPLHLFIKQEARQATRKWMLFCAKFRALRGLD